MPWIAFVDDELSKELEKIDSGDDKKELFPEFSFYGTCIRAGLTLMDLKSFTYVSIMKILLSFIEEKNESTKKKATQSDIDKLLG